MDLLLVVPRLAQRAGSFAWDHMPEAVDKMWSGGSVIADATGTTMNTTVTITSSMFAQSTAEILEASVREALSRVGEEQSSWFWTSVVDGFVKMKNIGGIFSYLSSKWALTTFAIAILLNRTQFYASSREHLRFRLHVRAAIYLVPISALIMQTIMILQGLRCQTSPNYSQLRYGDPLKTLAIDFGGEGGFIYWLSSTLLFWQDDATCCNARSMSMIGMEDDKSELRGTMSLLYWFFITLCTSQFFETLSCALQGKAPVPETGMTLFEHSLAFAECEAMISSILGLGFFGSKESGPIQASGIALTRGDVLQRLNVPPEVLLVCLISCFSHLSSATLAVFGIRQKARLVNTGIWACCYMTTFVWSFLKIYFAPTDLATDLGVLRFPTVCIVGFVPHFLIVCGILLCGGIYLLAMIFTAMSIPSDAAEGGSIRRRFAWAYHNLQANVQFSQSSTIRIKMSEDFYTTLLKIGFNVLTAASEAVYLNEGRQIKIANMTWLEQKRVDELAAGLEKRRLLAIPTELLGEDIARGLSFVDHQNAAIGQSPYARERKSKAVRTTQADKPNADRETGLGLAQRRSRMQLTGDFVAGIFWLVVGLEAHILLNLLRTIGVRYRPNWLLKVAGLLDRPSPNPMPAEQAQKDFLGFYMIGRDGRLSLARDDNIDVEAESRRRLERAGTYQGEEQLDGELWRWFRNGGWFGELDASGDYQEQDDDNDDTTSMISMSTNASTTDDQQEWEEESSGRRTPTQTDVYGTRNREGTPASDAGLDLGSLSRLLNPQTQSDREDAHLLSFRLQSNHPMTRSQYRRTTERSRAELLSGLRPPTTTQPTSDEEEERDLEEFLLKMRSKAKAATKRQSTWETGAEGMGESGPQCVVCQSTPRTVLVWPCGCLSMCDDCRVGLAARNYTKCICCRTSIAAYSRLFVP
ncbi:unnamed protein product [Zymoseptoria tritici ST99CH_1E4]|uniref:RING-type domain-containing protein n=1 Tax=Zymoseptoria tritici ST99CH_1E4 TaxID=1276532 RepID=A0A2H1GXR7_ZYMTR|nr:unnamed protein product [Zymoseptoria tritici ST99CH_1E4]